MNKELTPKDFKVSKALFNEWRSPRFGESNPQKIQSNVWQWLASTKISGYTATELMNGPSPSQAGPTWCFDRFGQSKTKLPDGRTIYIAGEHEDYYDPDFYIYNDVAILNSDGSFEFYCYPEEAFPPTDFHSATLVGDKIIIIGSLSYPKNRKVTTTQAAILNLKDFSISLAETSGDNPGWIHDHKARLNPDEQTLIITEGMVDPGQENPLKENIDDWSLDIKTWKWSRLTNRNWPQFEVHRRNKTRNYLWEARQAVWSKKVNWAEHHEKEINQLEKSLGHLPDLEIIKSLYEFDFEHAPFEEDTNKHNTYSIQSGDIKIRFIEDRFYIKVIIEGNLDINKITHIQESLMTKLSKFENTTYILQTETS